MLDAPPDRIGILGADDSSPSSQSSLIAATELSVNLCLLMLLAVRCGTLRCGPAPRPILAALRVLCEESVISSFKEEKDSWPSSLMAATELSASLCRLIELAVLIGAFR